MTKKLVLIPLKSLLDEFNISESEFITSGTLNSAEGSIDLFIKKPIDLPLYKINLPINAYLDMEWQVEYSQIDNVKFLQLSQKAISEIISISTTDQYYFSTAVVEYFNEESPNPTFIEKNLYSGHAFGVCTQEHRIAYAAHQENKSNLRTIYLTAKGEPNVKILPVEPVTIKITDGNLFTTSTCAEIIRGLLGNIDKLSKLSNKFPLLKILSKGCHLFLNKEYKKSECSDFLKEHQIAEQDSDRLGHILTQAPPRNEYNLDGDAILIKEQYPHLTNAVAIITSLCEKLEKKEITINSSDPQKKLEKSGFNVRNSQAVIRHLKKYYR